MQNKKWPMRDGNGNCRARMDFTVEVLHADDATRIVQLQLIPDPRRYDRIEKDGEAYFFDRYLRYVISEDEMLGKCAERMVGLPLYHLPSSIKSAPSYAATRRTALDAELSGGEYIPPEEKAVPHQSFSPQSTTKWIVFLSVDICQGTALRRTNEAAFEDVYKLFLRELGTVVGQFNGTILKTTGDGFIAYIDHPSFTQQSDSAIDMGLSLLVVLQNSINPALAQVGLPNLHIRVGADCGDAYMRRIEVPLTGFSETEVASDALNRAVKIEQTCEENEFRIGRNLYELIHVQWLERANEVFFEGDSVGIPGYQAYRVS